MNHLGVSAFIRNKNITYESHIIQHTVCVVGKHHVVGPKVPVIEYVEAAEAPPLRGKASI